MNNIFTVTRKKVFVYLCESFSIGMQLLHRYNPADYDGFVISKVYISKVPGTTIFHVAKRISLS